MKVIAKSGNIIEIGKNYKRSKPCWAHMSHRELVLEMKFMDTTRKKFIKLCRDLYECDPRGMWTPELNQVEKSLGEFVTTCDWFIKQLEKELISRGLK